MSHAPEKRLLLVSNSTVHGEGYLHHCASAINAFLGDCPSTLFVPYALADHQGYADKARESFSKWGRTITSIHEAADPVQAVEQAHSIFIGGGNTFCLLNALYQNKLIEPIRKRAAQGMPYMGSSAGTNVACLTIGTTNDMPIVQPPSFEALQLAPFNINPHYLDPDPNSKHMGETREERILQFHEENAQPVVGLREGNWLLIEGDSVQLQGTTGARLFQRGQAPRELASPGDLSFLLQ